MHGWTVQLEFACGAIGSLSLISPRHGDFEEGFRIHGEHGMVNATAPLPWFQRSHVETFKDGTYHRVLGEDGYTFKRQIEGFAATVLEGVPQYGADINDGIATVRALVAISHSVAYGGRVRLAEVAGDVIAPELEDSLMHAPLAVAAH